MSLIRTTLTIENDMVQGSGIRGKREETIMVRKFSMPFLALMFFAILGGCVAPTMQYKKPIQRALSHAASSIVRELMQDRTYLASVLDPVHARGGWLYVNLDPLDARVRILNIRPKYKRGMELTPGSYHIEISREGYETVRQWKKVAKGESLVVDISLKPMAAVTPAAKSLVPVAVESVTPPMPEKSTQPPPPAHEGINPQQARKKFGRYYALICGINNYQHLPNLGTAVHDARVVAKILEENYGYHVKLLLNPTRYDLLTTLGQYRRILTAEDNLLIYYAGHGWLDRDADQGYWLPSDATRDNQVNWVSNTAITSEILAIRAKHVMIVADSCYSGKITRGVHITQKTPDYLDRISSKKARVVLCSGGLEPVIDSGGRDDHSVFAAAFIDALRENDSVLDGNTLFTKIRRPIILNSDQTPEYSDIRKAGHDGGDFLFVRVLK